MTAVEQSTVQTRERKMVSAVVTEIDGATVTEFASGLRGELIRQGDDAYEAARKVYNAMIDKRPGLIVRCADVADVIRSVNFGRENKLTVAIRGGGHNGGGLGI